MMTLKTQAQRGDVAAVAEDVFQADMVPVVVKASREVRVNLWNPVQSLNSSIQKLPLPSLTAIMNVPLIS